jgi:DNA modification methylase
MSAAPDRLILADNRVVLAATPDACLDLIYIDPPFGTGTVRRGRRDHEAADRLVYADVPDDPERYVDWLAPCLTHSRRALAAHGSLFVHVDYRAVHYLKVALDRLFGRARFVNEIIWCYSVGGKGRRSFGKKHDTILWYGRSSDYAFFPDAVRMPRRAGSHMRVTLDADGQPVQEKTDRRTGKVYRYPAWRGKVAEDWWTDIETLNRGDRQRTGWPTQKPERLLERILGAASAPGAQVADWFCGSGTTAVVAQRTGRGFVAVDCAPAAVTVAATRLARTGRALAAAGSPPPDVDILRVPAYGGSVGSRLAPPPAASVSALVSVSVSPAPASSARPDGFAGPAMPSGSSSS